MTDTAQADAQTVAAEPAHIVIFDTTMRDGEQSPGASMSIEEKLELAKILEDMRVDVIEAGFPIASNGDFEAVRRVSEIVTESIVCGLARAGVADIERAAEAIRPARRGRIHTFISTSPQHREHMLRMSAADVIDAVTGSVSHARNLCGDVEWSAQVPGRGWSSPIVVGNRIFLTTAVTEGKSKPPQMGTEYSNEYVAELQKQGLTMPQIMQNALYQRQKLTPSRGQGNLARLANEERNT